MSTRVIGVTEFKAKCLALLDEIDREGGAIDITRRGRPIAHVEPAKKRPRRSPEGSLAGKLRIVGDIDNFETTDLWEALKD